MSVTIKTAREIEKMREITVDETWLDGEKIYERK